MIMKSLSADLATIRQKLQYLFHLYPNLKTAHPNTILIAYWKYYDQFGTVTLIPKEITNYHSIDRAIRDVMPDEYKHHQRAEEYRSHYAQEKDTR